MRHTDFSIDVTVTEMLNMMRKDSTPRKYARLLLEGAEIIKQLRKERDEARAKVRELPAEDVRPVVGCRDCFANGLCSVQQVLFDSDLDKAEDFFCALGSVREAREEIGGDA